MEHENFSVSNGGVAEKRSCLLSYFTSRPTSLLRQFGPDGSPLFVSTHYVVMTLQPIYLATSRGTFLYTPIFLDNSILSFLLALPTPNSAFPVVHVVQNSMSLHHFPALNLCIFFMRTLICMPHRIDDARKASIVQLSFVVGPNSKALENTI